MMTTSSRLMIALSLLFSIHASAQDAHEAKVRYSKKDHTGVEASYQAGKDQAEGALLKRLSVAGLNDKKKSKGFYVYRGVNWTEIMPEKVDVYVKVDGSGKKATAQVLIAKGYDNFISAASDPDAIGKLINVLNTLPADITDYQKTQELAAQQAAVAKAAADAKEAQKKADRAAKRQAKEAAKSAKKQAKLEEQQRKLSEMGDK